MVNAELDSDVAIIGAGPAGSSAAREIRNKGENISVQVFEKHPKIGKPIHCSGLCAAAGLQQLGLRSVNSRNEFILNVIKRAKFISPRLEYFDIIRDNDSMVLVDRSLLDQKFAKEAQDLGCNYSLSSRVVKIAYDGKKWVLFIKKGKGTLNHKSKLLIIAEGASARLTASLGLSTPDREWLFPAIQYEMENVQDLENDTVEIYFGRKYAPGFFGWLIPIDDESARIGIAISQVFKGNTKYFMKHFTRKHPSLKQRLSNSRVVKHNGGLVPVSGPIRRTYQSNLMIVGDAAGQTKATTGGGVNIGGFCGRLAGMTSRKIITEDINPSKGCRDYELLWKAFFEPDLSLMKYFRRMLTPLPDKTWNKIIKIAKDTNLGSNLKTNTIDLHGLALLKYSFNPHILIKSLDLIPQAAVSLFQGLFI